MDGVALLTTEEWHQLTYKAVGQSLSSQLPMGFRHIRRQELVSRDETDFACIGDALMSWNLHRRCLRVEATTPLEVGSKACLRSAILPGLVADVMVVATVAEPGRMGFAYGTLTRHPASGEEAFILTKSAAGVLFTVTAFSKPSKSIARLAGPLGRLVQDHFTRRYFRTMRQLSKNGDSIG